MTSRLVILDSDGKIISGDFYVEETKSNGQIVLTPVQYEPPRALTEIEQVFGATVSGWLIPFDPSVGVF